MTTEATTQPGPRGNAGRDGASLLIRTGREVWRKGLVNGANGNLSLRTGPEILITRSGVCKGRLEREDVIRVDVQTGQALDPGRASSETGLHLALYAAQPEAQAVVHVHPVALLALEQAGARLLAVDVYEAEPVRQELVPVPGLPPGSQDLARAVARAAGSGRAVYMARHGLVCWGKDVEQALNLAEEVEALARVQLLAAGYKTTRP